MFKNIILKMFLVGMQLKDHSRVSKIFFKKICVPQVFLETINQLNQTR